MRPLLLAVLSFFSLAAQHNKNVDFLKINAEITPIANSKEIVGRATYDFKINANVDSIFIDAIDLTFLYVALNGKPIDYSNSRKELTFKAPSKGGNHNLFVRYIAKPKQTVYFLNAVTEKSPSDQNDKVASSNPRTQSNDYKPPLKNQVWTQGQGKYTSHWLPSFDAMTEKVELDLTILADEEYAVISNGKLLSKSVEDGLAEWKFDMLDPMSSYLAAFVIGDFDKKVLKSKSGIPIELYYEPEDSLKVEPTYRYTKEIFDYLEEEIGFPYPWQNYKQVPVQDFLYAGMENTGTTIFSNQYMIDSTAFVDKNYVNVNAHEMAHQWFGNLVTEESGKHHWLHEGFATYYAYLAEQHLFGDDHFYWKIYETAKTLYNLSENGDGEALTNPNANSLTFYEKGAWALVLLKERVGEEAFKTGTKNYLAKHQFQNVTIGDYLKELELTSNQDLSSYRQTWLASEEFPWNEVVDYLKSKSESIRSFLSLQKNRLDDSNQSDSLIELWHGLESDNLKSAVLKAFNSSLLESSFLDTLEQEAYPVRRSFMMYNDSIPVKLKDRFERFLDDKSYVTQEILLFKLWNNFPDSRTDYLERTKDIIGLPNQNVRLLWLTLALVTPEYEQKKKQQFYKELNEYTASYHHFEVRQLAFQYLYQIDALSDKSLLNLITASEHHVWQFKKSSRNLIRTLANNEKLKERLLKVSSSLTLAQRNALNKLINQ